MGLSNKIDTCITNFDFKKLDIENIEKENKILMDSIKKIKLDGEEQPLFVDRLSTIVF